MVAIAGRPFDATNRASLNANVGVQSVPTPVGFAHQIANAGGSTNYLEFGQGGLDLSGPFTLALLIRRIENSSGNYDRIWHSNGNNTGNNRFGFFLTGAGEGIDADKIYIQVTTSSGGTVSALNRPAQPKVSTTEFEFWAATYDGANCRLSRNGVVLVTNAGSGYPTATLPNPVRFGTDSASNNGAPVQIAFAAGFRGALSGPELGSLSANPWQLFAPRRIFVPVTAGSALPTLSAPTFVPGSLTSTGWRGRVTAS